MFTRVWYQAISYYFAKPSYSVSVTDTSGNPKYITSKLENVVNDLSQALKLANGSSMLYFGDGDKAPTLDDYWLSGNLISSSTYSCSSVVAANPTDGTTTITYTLTNSGTESFTVREVGAVIYTYSVYVLALREVLDTPVTIEPGGVGQVTLTFKVNIPE